MPDHAYRILAATVGLLLATAGSAAPQRHSEQATEQAVLDGASGAGYQTGYRSVTWENDIGYSDRYYTNGLRYQALRPNPEATDAGTPGTFLSFPFRAWWPCSWRAARGEATGLGFAVGQNFYTPENIDTPFLERADRPYGAALYYGLIVQQTRGSLTVTTELDLGLIGPLALGESVQTGWHELIQATRPLGWDNQIPTFPVLQWTAIFQGPLWTSSKTALQTSNFCVLIDGFQQLGAGTVMLSSETGATLAAGVRPDGGLRRISHALQMSSIPRNSGSALRLFGFTRARIALRPWNVFLNGTPDWRYERSHHVDGKDWFYEYELGLTFGSTKWDFTLSRMERGREFEGAGIQHFLAGTLRWPY